MTNNEIVIYRYHKDFDLVRERLKLIKYFDPEIRIYGIFGGNSSNFDEATKSLDNLIENNYLVKSEDGNWKWLHADITYKMWFEDYGQNIDFDRAYVLEWDLLIVGSLRNIYTNQESNTIYCSGLISIDRVKKFWYWTNDQNLPKISSFFQKVKDTFNTSFVQYAMLGPGLSAPRKFFEGLKTLNLFEAEVTDEVKVPVWAQLLGLKLKNNHFYNRWFSYFEMRYFNANVGTIRPKVVLKQLKKINGRRVFHPFRENLSAQSLIEWYEKAPQNGISSFYKRPARPAVVIFPFTYKFHCKLSNIFLGV